MTRNIVVLAAAIAVNFAVAVPAGAATPEERAQEAASEGAAALRTFVHRTRMIYALDIRAFSVPAHDAVESADVRGRGEEAWHLEHEYAEYGQIYRDTLPE